MSSRLDSARRHRADRSAGTTQRGFLILFGVNVALALLLYFAQGDEYWFLGFSILSLFWNLLAALGARIAFGKDLAKGFLLAAGMTSLASFALCASLGFAL